MLLITRSAQQEFSITTPCGVISILVLGFSETGKSVHLGIEAPKNFAIHRDNAKVKK